jgi:DNA-binding LytR/AlgR family response regulator
MPSALIAEDEAHLRSRLRHGLAALWPELSISAVAADGVEALEAFERMRPDVAFLDIRMPRLSGLEVARRIGPQCHVVFVTAYDNYAVDAFERGAIDYLLKPIDSERLAITIERLRQRIGQPPVDLCALLKQLSSVAQAAPPPRRHLEWIKASRGMSVDLIAVRDVRYFQAGDRYLRVVHAQGEALIGMSIRELLEQLDPQRFWQVHRATVVNVDVVAGVTRRAQGGVELRLKHGGKDLQVSRAFAYLFKGM